MIRGLAIAGRMHGNPGARGCGALRRGLPAQQCLARRPVVRQLERRCRTLPAYLDDLRLPARRLDRGAAIAISRGGPALRRAKSPTRSCRSSPIASAADSGSRPRARIPALPAEELRRRCDALRQRDRRPGARRVSAGSRARAATSRPRRRDPGRACLTRARAGGACRDAERARRIPRPRRDRRSIRGAAAEAQVLAGGARARVRAAAPGARDSVGCGEACRKRSQ